MEAGRSVVGGAVGEEDDDDGRVRAVRAAWRRSVRGRTRWRGVRLLALTAPAPSPA